METLHKFDEAAAQLGVSVDSLRRLVRANRLRVVSLSPRVRRVPESALTELIQGTAGQNPPEAA